MRPRSKENRDLPPNVYHRRRKRKNGKVWVGYYYRDATGKEVSLGSDLDQARMKWAELEAKAAALEDGDAHLALRIASFQFRDIRPKAASAITDVKDASKLLGHSEGDITERVHRRVGAIAKPAKQWSFGTRSRSFRNSCRFWLGGSGALPPARNEKGPEKSGPWIWRKRWDSKSGGFATRRS